MIMVYSKTKIPKETLVYLTIAHMSRESIYRSFEASAVFTRDDRPENIRTETVINNITMNK